MECVQLLQGHPFFETFSPASLETLCAKAQTRGFEQPEVVIRYGAPVQHLGVVLQGTCAVLVPEGAESEGLKRQVATLVAGDMFGEMSLLTGEPATAEVVASAGATLVLIPQPELALELAGNPRAIQHLGRLLADRMRRRAEDEREAATVDRARQGERRARSFTIEPQAGVAPVILVLELGSSWLGYGLLDASRPGHRVRGRVDRIGEGQARHSWRRAGDGHDEVVVAADHGAALAAVLARLVTREGADLGDLSRISAIGHRVAHGGARFSQPAVVDDAVIAEIEDLGGLTPPDNRLALAGIRACRTLLPGIPQVAVFDTAFHHTVPEHAAVYAIPHSLGEQHHLRRYGFQGIAHKYVAQRAAAHLSRSFGDLRIISCHLDDQASVCAIDHGRSVETSMGMTPLEGLVMSTRSGDVDPGLLLQLMTRHGRTPAELDRLLDQQSGLLGLSGISGDMAELTAAAAAGHERARLAISAFCHRVKKYVGAYVAVLGGVDVLVFTGRIGQGSEWIRARACQGLSAMGLVVDEMLNRAPVTDPDAVRPISDPSAPVKVLVVPTDEQAMIARETVDTLGLSGITEVIRRREDLPIPVNTSAHHAHLCQVHVEALFGPGHQLTRRSDLQQPGQFACEEAVTLVGPKGSVERVRILGPTRKESQVEISRTEEFKLGIDAPIRASGDVNGSPGLTLRGPQGEVKLERGVICAMRHIHASPEDAMQFALRDRDVVRVRIPGERSLTFGDVLVRVHPDFKLEMHIDTDEANAAELGQVAVGFLDGIQSRRA